LLLVEDEPDTARALDPLQLRDHRRVDGGGGAR
jgi:hypothetical protein